MSADGNTAAVLDIHICIMLYIHTPTMSSDGLRAHKNIMCRQRVHFLMTCIVVDNTHIGAFRYMLLWQKYWVLRRYLREVTCSEQAQQRTDINANAPRRKNRGKTGALPGRHARAAIGFSILNQICTVQE